MTYPIEKIRNDFPILNQEYKKTLVFFDTTASAQKPRQVIDGLHKFYETSYANIHRGLYTLSQNSSSAYELARTKVKSFINANDDSEIIFTKNTTESLNLVANGLGKTLQEGDEVLLTEAEHHANIVPWHFLRKEKGIIIKWIPINDDGSLRLDELDTLITEKTKVVSITHLSNVLGLVYPIKKIIKKAHDVGAITIVDGCQSVVHMKIDVQDLDCDFFALSSHKLYGPSGVGVLYGKKHLLDNLEPLLGGGGMVGNVDFDNVTYAKSPAKFEAGTPAIAEAVGLGYAIDYINEIDIEEIQKYEENLTSYMAEQLSTLEWVNIIGTGKDKTGIFSFFIDGIHPQDIAMILNKEGVAVRSGHHCAEPLHRKLNVPFLNTVRASLGMYNTKQEIDIFITALKKVKDFFK